MNEIATSPEASSHMRGRRKHNRIDRWCQLLVPRQGGRATIDHEEEHCEDRDLSRLTKGLTDCGGMRVMSLPWPITWGPR